VCCWHDVPVVSVALRTPEYAGGVAEGWICSMLMAGVVAGQWHALSAHPRPAIRPGAVGLPPGCKIYQ
jgi:hypothetical protein